MSDIKWVKLTTDMFDNRKIKYLRTLPEGNNIVLIWVMLLTIAGRCNSGGMIFLTENIPYNYSMLADELGFEVNTVKLALDALANLGMIICDEKLFQITNWAEYQNIDGMEKVKEQNRIRQQNKRAKDRALLAEKTDVSRDSHVTDNVTVTHSSYSISNSISEKNNKNNRGCGGKKEFVPPTLEEVTDYCKSRNSSVDPKSFYEYFTEGKWIDSKGQPVRNWKQKLITWEGHSNDSGRNHGSGKTDTAVSQREWNLSYDN